ALSRRRVWVGLVAVTVVSLGLAYGWPLLTELRRLPGLGHAANTRFIFTAAFGFACLAGLGLDAALRRRPRWVAWAATALAALWLLLAAGLALFPVLLLPSAEGAAPLTALDAVL